MKKKTPLDQMREAMMREFNENEIFDTISKCQEMRLRLAYNSHLTTALMTQPNNGSTQDELSEILVSNLWKSKQLLIRIIELKNQ